MARRVIPGSPLLAVAYLRVSTDDQRLGPDAQRDAIRAWAARAAVSVVAELADHGVSGGSDVADRPALLAALDALRVHRAGVLAVAKRDRLARDVYVSATIERAVAARGARVAAADGTANGDSPADAFMRTILDGAAAYERALIRARTKAALATKKARGERAGNVPYGYDADDAGRLVPNDHEQAARVRMRDLAACGLSVRAIAAQLAAEGLASRRSGKPYGKSQIARVLRQA